MVLVKHHAAGRFPKNPGENYEPGIGLLQVAIRHVAGIREQNDAATALKRQPRSDYLPPGAAEQYVDVVRLARLARWEFRLVGDVTHSPTTSQDEPRFGQRHRSNWRHHRQPIAPTTRGTGHAVPETLLDARSTE